MRLRCCVRSGATAMFNCARIDFAAAVPWQPFVSFTVLAKSVLSFDLDFEGGVIYSDEIPFFTSPEMERESGCTRLP